MSERNPNNVPGPFYVVKDECIACGAPEMEAEGLMSHDGTSQCFFARQPQSVDETNAAIRATLVSCCRSVRYGGSDAAILMRFAEFGSDDLCDHKLSGPVVRLRRNSARFTFNGPAAYPEPISRTLIQKLADTFHRSEYSDLTDFIHGPTKSAFTSRWGSRSVEQRNSIRLTIQHERGDSWLLLITDNPLAEAFTAVHCDKFLQGQAAISNVEWCAMEDLFRPTGIRRPRPY